MSSPALTAEQRRAIQTRGVSIALDAGAGCGKTFVLTERFLSHVAPAALGRAAEPRPNPADAAGDPVDADADAGAEAGPAGLDQLIAITFTQAAAREMRERIRRACHQRLREGPAEQAGHWLAVVRSLDGAQVSTIHSFCGKLLRGHAVELGIDPAFQTLEGPAAGVLRGEAIDATLRRLLSQRDPLLMRLAAERDLSNLRGELLALADLADSDAAEDWAGRTPADVVAAWREAYQRDYLPAAVQRVVDAEAFARMFALLPLARPEGARFADVRAELLALREGLAAGPAGVGDLKRLAELARVQGRCKPGEWPDKQAYSRYAEACKGVRELAGRVKPLADGEDALAAARRGLELLRLASEVSGDYAKLKRGRGLLDFDDLLRQTRRLLREPAFEPARRRLQQRVRLLMVDEFQDTDPTQAEIVRAIAGSGLLNGRLFFVGDFKQSIYRFRGAAPDVFRRLQAETPVSGRLPLSRNFRSQPAILRFVNTLFAPVFGAGYRALHAARPQVTAAPAVEFLWTPPTASAGAEAERAAEARAIATRLRRLIDDRAPLVGEQAVAGSGGWRARPVRAGDVAILFRALSDVRHYEQALREQGLAHYLVGGHAFYAQQEVYDVANLLRAVASGCDEVALAGVLRSPLFALQDETLFWLAQSGGLAAAIQRSRPPSGLPAAEAAKVRHAQVTLGALRRAKGRRGVAGLLCEAVERTGLDAVLLAEFLGERKRANLEKLIDQAAEFDRLRPGDLDGFARQLNEFVARESKEALAATRTAEDSHRDEVRLMTVHQAKGLEFPVVVLADADRKQGGHHEAVGLRPDLGPVASVEDDTRVYGIHLLRHAEREADRTELERLLYVACTRAADYLIFSACREAGAKPAGPLLEVLAGGFDLETGVASDEEDPQACVTVGEPREAIGPGGLGADPRATLDRAQEIAASAPPPAVPPGLRPVPLDPLAVRAFSVNRLSGRLKHAGQRPGPVAVAAALASTAAGVDPLGLGTLVHEVLERLPLAPAGLDRVDALAGALAPLHLSREIDAGARLAAGLVQRFADSSRYATLLAAERVEREVEFLLRWPSAMGGPPACLHGYIDCLVDTGAALEVLDYKTNRVAPAAVRRAAEEYRLQMYVYAWAVEQARGRSPSRAVVHFLRPGVEVVFDWDDAARGRARRMVDDAIAAVRADAVQAAAGAWPRGEGGADD